MGRKPRTDKRCQWTSSRDGSPCKRWATHRNPEQDVWVCAMHKSWVPGRAPGNPLSENQRTYRLKKKRDRSAKHRTNAARRCAFITKTGMPCSSFVVDRLEDGRDVCQHHKYIWRDLDEHERQFLEHKAVQAHMESRLPAIKPDKEPVKAEVVVSLPDVEEQLEELDKLADKQDDYSVRFKQPKIRTGTSKSAFFGVDVEYYTPDFKYDYVYLLMTAIRRAEAQVNIYFQQLQRIERDEKLLRQTVREGTMAGEKGVMEFSNIETRYSVPVELKLKLMDNLTKAEAHYAKLLKQLQELPLVALMVLRKMGVRWDREAAMMVIHKIEKQENQVLDDFGAINPLPTEQLPLEKMVEAVQDDPKMAKKFKNLATDDDW